MTTYPGTWEWKPVYLLSDDGQKFEILREFNPREMIVKGITPKKFKSSGHAWKTSWTRTEHDRHGAYEASAISAFG